MTRVLSGIQPSGGVHLGNCFGALEQWVALQDKYDSYYCVVDLHALTVPHDPEALARCTRETLALLLAVGIDPARSTGLHPEPRTRAHRARLALGLCHRVWRVARMVQFKERSKTSEFVSVGLFSYPVLMASDILLYEPDLVPTGDDQRQHLELTRDLADRFNSRFSKVMTRPEA